MGLIEILHDRLVTYSNGIIAPSSKIRIFPTVVCQQPRNVLTRCFFVLSTMILFIVLEFAATSVERYFGNRGYNVDIFFDAKFLPFFKNKMAMEKKLSSV